MTRRRPLAWDLASAALIAVALAAEGIQRGRAGWLLIVVVAALPCLPLAWRSTAPLAALLATSAGLVVCLVTFHPYDTAILPVLVALYSVAALGHRQRSLAAGIGVSLFLIAVIGEVEQHEGWLGQFVARLFLIAGALVIGDTVRTRRALAEAQRERAARDEAEREEAGRRRVVAARVRIARELHDTIAHALVAINVQAGVAAHLGDAAGSQAALTDIKQTSADALGDLRATLGLLREPGDAAPVAPVLDLEAVEQLVSRARAAGLHATTQVDLGGRTIPSSVGQAAFRIAQESVTNVLRHARATATTISLRVVDEALAVEVTDDGPGTPRPLGEPEGHGVQGMRERAKALGGSVVAGPAAAGGWRVVARLPLTPVERS